MDWSNHSAIAQALKVPPETIDNPAYWLTVKAALDALGLSSDNQYIGALATLRVETNWKHPMIPCNELGDEARFTSLYWTDPNVRRNLGNTSPQDAVNFCGRGYQITGRWNYQHYGDAIGVNLIANPLAANDPQIAAQLFAAMWKSKCASQADTGDWEAVRHRYNGGLNGLQDFLGYVKALQSLD